jgi:hypothetical protein
MPVIEQLHELILARQRFAHGVQTLFFDHPNCIAFSRSGTEDDPGCVVVMSNGDDGEKVICLGKTTATKRGVIFSAIAKKRSPRRRMAKGRLPAKAEASACG